MVDELKPIVASVKKGTEIDFADKCEAIIRNGLTAGLDLKYFQAFPPNADSYGNSWYGIIVMIPKINAETDKGK